MLLCIGRGKYRLRNVSVRVIYEPARRVIQYIGNINIKGKVRYPYDITDWIKNVRLSVENNVKLPQENKEYIELIKEGCQNNRNNFCWFAAR